MKKVILGIMMAATFTACKKENKTVESSENMKTDSVTVPESNETTEAATPFKKIELNPEQTAKFLGKQNNDTLYVNNFFATWCGPCMQEIPHFKKKMEEMKGQPVKFTFVDLDQKEDWDTKVKNFAEKEGLSNHMVLIDGSKLTPEFFKANFKKWDGGAIPFTFIRKGDKTDETLGSMSEEMLTEKLNSFK
ncbi:TlpA family protein disulfide reductase [Kaistella sp. G5-32]|uniref:TlpA family protein disulfide reductase n=1 Tax=Kaistella gelatinilytica TaxID=2787636 RepID=A0ABS0F8H6_9FLAO|nr:TlpA disulfide reductase family protein [Kaistella gelatinilytica]MBF8456014.1 TlpA family protein disulfide reductase [Kaistella gelatinilytica]